MVLRHRLKSLPAMENRWRQAGTPNNQAKPKGFVMCRVVSRRIHPMAKDTNNLNDGIPPASTKVPARHGEPMEAGGDA